MWAAALSAMCSTHQLPAGEVVRPTEVISLFEGKTLDQFETWLVDHKNKDPNRVFTVVPHIDGAPAIRISGEDWGGLITKRSFRDYRLVVEFRWGLLTWGKRSLKARDAGILLHCEGQYGNFQADFNGPWMRSIEYQFIEGGTGDLLLVRGFDQGASKPVSPSLVSPADDVLRVWKKDGKPRSFTGGRIDWYGRDPAWRDVLGFRGVADVERPVGEWNRVEVECRDATVRYWLNGHEVNGGTEATLTEGPIFLQSEGAELYVRKVELHPLPSQ